MTSIPKGMTPDVYSPLPDRTREFTPEMLSVLDAERSDLEGSPITVSLGRAYLAMDLLPALSLLRDMSNLFHGVPWVKPEPESVLAALLSSDKRPSALLSALLEGTDGLSPSEILQGDLSLMTYIATEDMESLTAYLVAAYGISPLDPLLERISALPLGSAFEDVDARMELDFFSRSTYPAYARMFMAAAHLTQRMREGAEAWTSRAEDPGKYYLEDIAQSVKETELAGEYPLIETASGLFVGQEKESELVSTTFVPFVLSRKGGALDAFGLVTYHISSGAGTYPYGPDPVVVQDSPERIVPLTFEKWDLALRSLIITQRRGPAAADYLALL